VITVPTFKVDVESVLILTDTPSQSLLLLIYLIDSSMPFLLPIQQRQKNEAFQISVIYLFIYLFESGSKAIKHVKQQTQTIKKQDRKLG